MSTIKFFSVPDDLFEEFKQWAESANGEAGEPVRHGDEISIEGERGAELMLRECIVTLHEAKGMVGIAHALRWAAESMSASFKWTKEDCARLTKAIRALGVEP